MQRALLVVALAACGRVNFDALADNGDARDRDAPRRGQKSVPMPAWMISGLTHMLMRAVPTSTVSNSGNSGVFT